jgi:uncharacterized protein (DUF1501 family)
MNRKEFLRATVPVAAASVMTYSLRKYMHSNVISKAPRQDRILVMVQLDGGNDGLNTIIPLDQYAQLSEARRPILIPEKEVIKLKGTTVTGFHPSMSDLARLYEAKHLTVIQGVSYPDPIFSHFRAIDIWHTGSGASTVLNTGWLGRFLEREYPNYPIGYPNPRVPAPPAIQVGTVLSNALQGSKAGLGITVNSTKSFYDMVLGNPDIPENSPMGHELAYISRIASQTKDYLIGVKKAATAQKNLSPLYPPSGENALADQLKIVAQLIGGGLESKVYMVNLPEFDTHHNQVDKSNTLKGTHAYLLSQLSVAIAAFEDDLERMGKLDLVLGMAYSEFGRRIKSNASLGTDHGSSGPVILFGSKLKGGLIGTNPTIPEKVKVDDNLPMQHDFRSVYASILKGWFHLSDTDLQAVMLDKYPTLDLFV